MNIGDKVRFLNEVGGGIVSGFQGRDIVLVEDEDGFDVPMLRSECVVVATDNYNVAMTEQEIKKAKATEESNRENALDSPVLETKEGDLLSVFLVFSPQDIKNISTTSFDAYLINDSNYFMYYTYANITSSGKLSARSHDLIAPNTKIYVETFTKAVLNDLENIRIQLIAFKHDRDYVAKAPVDVELKIDPVKFYKLHSFVDTPYFEEEVLLYDVVVKDIARKAVKVDAKELKEALLSKPEFKPRKSTPLVKKNVKNAIIEVDLHIDELLDSTAGLDNKAMLEHQLLEFRKVMNENMNHKNQKIVFIHGKGDGVLRKAILKELKRSYASCIYQDASFQEYGFGATMITIR